MAKYTWNKTLSVGDEHIDNDHKELFELVNELQTADMSRDFLSGIIDRLDNYAREHFSYEEGYMRAANYPDLEPHIQAHKMFSEWIASVKKTYTRAPESPFVIGEQVNEFVSHWLVEHIIHMDMKYRDFILDKKS